MKRKIVQIAVQEHTKEGDGGRLVALADDGTLWEGGILLLNADELSAARRAGAKTPAPKYGWQWVQIPDLPQNTSNLTKVK